MAPTVGIHCKDSHPQVKASPELLPFHSRRSVNMCMLWGTRSLTTNVTQVFPFSSEHGEIWRMWLLYDQGHPAQQLTPTGNICISQPEQGQTSNTGYQLSWAVLFRSTTWLPGIQSMHEYIQSNTGIDFTQPKEWNHRSFFILPFHPSCPFHLLAPVRKSSC